MFSLPARSDWTSENAFAVWEDMDSKNPKNINAKIASQIIYKINLTKVIAHLLKLMYNAFVIFFADVVKWQTRKT